MGTDGSVKNIRCISSLNIRVAHEAKGIAGAVLPYLYEEKKLCSTLLINPFPSSSSYAYMEYRQMC